jgi:subtilisin family serine protease
MPNVWSKLDPGLSRIYSNFVRARDPQRQERGELQRAPSAVTGTVRVVLRYVGDLSAVERAGFKRIWDDGRSRATGSIRLDDLERVAGCDEVIHLASGREHLHTLNLSVPDVKADQIWNLSAGVFSGTSGAGVIVGIIDTGIDFRHPFFLKPGNPLRTRILRIWDQGLVPTGNEKHPDELLIPLSSPTPYGVEYDEHHLNEVLQEVPGAMPVRHRDCGGHGSHVASIAAGNGQERFKYVGVAPEADLVVVKLLDPETEPTFISDAGTPEPVPFIQRFFDAVTYIRRIAQGIAIGIEARPLVINYSAGDTQEPHDGLSEQESFLTDTFDPANSAGLLFVNSAGNASNSRQHASVEFPSGGGTFVINFELYDDRKKKTEFDFCQWKNSAKALFISCYYPAGGPLLVAAEFRGVGGSGFAAAPALNTAFNTDYLFNNIIETSHFTVTNLSGGGTVRRNLLEVTAHPGLHDHHVGQYTLSLTASDAMTVHIWCSQPPRHGFKFGDSQIARVVVEDRFLISSPAGAANIITVGCFDAEEAALPVASFSSRGPLVQYDPAVPVPAVKPDLCAPGVGVDAARSRDSRPLWPSAVIAKSGTSMSAPHVTGTLALMLQKKPDLTPADALAFLKAGVRATPPADVDTFGAGRLDAKGAFDSTP